MIKIDDDMTYKEFLKLVSGHQCKIIFKDGTFIYVDNDKDIQGVIFCAVDYVEILDQKRASIADKAKEIIYGDREKTYGNPDKTIQLIADMWSVYTGSKLEFGDICNMLCLLKIARLKNTPGHEDSMVDLIGYTLLQERIINKC